MKIDSTEFGSITVNGTPYSNDILIQLSGEVVKRKKKPLKNITAPPTSFRWRRRNSFTKKAAIRWCWVRDNMAM